MGIRISARSKTVLARVKGVDKTLDKSLRKGLYFVGKKLEQTASDNILKRPKSGKVYRYKGRRHVASSPGKSWANRSGQTRRGLVYNVVGSRKLEFGNTEKVAKFMEDGTIHIKPRPAHLIAIKENNRNIMNILEAHIEKAFDAS